MKSSFQTILVVVFGVVFAGAVLIFSGLVNIGGSKSTANTPSGNVVVWGVAPQDIMEQYFSNFNITNQGYSISYFHHDAQNLASDLTVALANNVQPDLILFSSDTFTEFADKLSPIPYTTYTERQYRDTNVDGAQIFLTKDGVIGVPIVVDPMVLYYNKDLLAQGSFVVPPKTWAIMQQTVPVFTQKDSRNAVTQSAIALGTVQNISHMQDILSTLFMQTGNSIVSYDASTGRYVATLGSSGATTTSSAVAQALDFYVSFANPINANYSWNNGLPESRTQFLAGKSTFYLGFASELFSIQAQNPNLNFDVTEMLQTSNTARSVTYGTFYGLGMVKSAKNPVAAYAALSALSASTSIDAIAKALSLPPSQRALLLVQQANPYVSVFFKAALSTFAWANPNPAKTQQIFADMVNAVASGKTDSLTAVNDAQRELQSLTR